MDNSDHRIWRYRILLLAAFFLFSGAGRGICQTSKQTAKAYAAWSGGTLIPSGRTEIDGRLMTCGSAPTVLDPQLGDFGESYSGFIVLNPKLFVGLATPVKLWIYSHECAHQTVGPDEAKADCVAVERGRREGWLNAAGLAQVCAFMKPANADSVHFSGPRRCELMKRCFVQGTLSPS
ncbi:MAG TPA: hypothetical protein VMU69_25035 [Bradyrhizobium sp.]|nr:hypothetical protein [Bradyrhizobium sp.]